MPHIEELQLENDSLDLDYYLKHEYESIDVANQELPALVEWLNYHLQWFVEEKHRSKQKIKEREAEAYVYLASGGLERNHPELKKTDAVITRAIALDAEVKKAHENYARVCGWTSRLQNTLISLQLKIDLVRSSEATNRKVFSVGGEDDEERNDSTT